MTTEEMLKVQDTHDQLMAKNDRLTAALKKIAKRWPPSTASDMARVASEALGSVEQTATEPVIALNATTGDEQSGGGK